MDRWPLGVFASVDAGLGVKLEIAHELGVPTVQLHVPHKESRTAEHAKRFLERLEKFGIRVTVVFCGFEGESYADIPTSKRTVGLVPPATQAARLAEMKEIADFAKQLGVEVVGIHVGFLPEEKSDPLRKELVSAVGEVCDYLAANGQRLHFETGQETADALAEFLVEVNRPNLFINFDPANMILYGSGDPIEALRKIGRYVRSVHCKDAKWSAEPGKSWGSEVPFGEGDVNAELFLKTLREVGYEGPLTIEREIPQEPERQKEEIGRAVRVIESLKAKIL